MILQFCSFQGVDICQKLAHPVLSRHRHRRSLFYQSHISSLHRQTGSFQVIRQKNLEFFFFRHNFSNFYKTDKFLGAEFRGALWDPKRLLPNIPIFLFVLVVPTLYGIIYRFRKKHTTTSLGWYLLRTGMFLSSGISESEREQRKQSNIFTTKINFLAWLIEVTLIT